MPTPTGKPKVGERVRWRATIFGEHGPWREGLVIRRTDGELWSLKVRLDGGTLPEKGTLLHKVNLLYPDFYMDVVSVGRYVRIQHLGPTYDGVIARVSGVQPLGAGDELYQLEGHTICFFSHTIELLPADYIYRTEYEAAVKELGEDYFA